MQPIVSKSEFKAKALELLRWVERKKQPLTITHNGQPVIQVAPYRKKSKEVLNMLKGTVISYKDPTNPISGTDWEVLK